MRQTYLVLVMKKENLKSLDEDIYMLYRNDKADNLFYRKEDASTQGMKLAQANPGTEVILFSSVEIFETEIPKVFKRQFNSKGELLPNE